MDIQSFGLPALLLVLGGSYALWRWARWAWLKHRVWTRSLEVFRANNAEVLRRQAAVIVRSGPNHWVLIVHPAGRMFAPFADLQTAIRVGWSMGYVVLVDREGK